MGHFMFVVSLLVSAYIITLLVFPSKKSKKPKKPNVRKDRV
jgi:phage shock protein PspC (stress-responsive transcriptional regulator)